ncbi:hypothetical protein A9Q99_13000 [Gammaproteobacteria bacterium 45_16_T64]|nr:hypothetical protein A9Q99_13000 [Gammaproteobacteria bacterium 45_16_T64]
MSPTTAHDCPYVNSSFLNQFGELVLSRGGDIVELCAQVGMPIEAITGGQMLIPFDRFIALLEATASALTFPDIAFALAQRQDITILGPLSVMLYDCKSAAEALHTIVEYFQLIVSGLEIEVIPRESTVELHYHCYLPTLYHRPQFQNYLLASTIVTFRGLVGDSYPIRGCFFSQLEPSPQVAKQFSQFFRCPIAFGTDSLRITFDRAFMDVTPEIMTATLSKKISASMASKTNIVDQVSNVIALCLPSQKADLKTVAASMGYSTRTLHRKLAKSSTSFNALLDSVRLSHANQYLSGTHYRLTDIAALLGYNNLSAFTRSYQRWCGTSPSAARKSYRLIQY